MKAVFLGDIHGNFYVLDNIIRSDNPDLIIQVGDFGIYPGYYDKVKTQNDTPVYFCRGNHENHDILGLYPANEITSLSFKIESDINFPESKNIYFCSDGSILELNNKKILFVGGANSIDKNLRVEGVSWWRQEVPSNLESCRILDIADRNRDINIIVSHTMPESLCEKIYPNPIDSDPTRKLLDRILEMIHPSLWVFGHFHSYLEMEHKDTMFIGLDMFVNESDRIYKKIIEI